MDIEKKKKIAAITGVLYYLKNEESENENINLMKKDTGLNYISPWAAYNRQSVMRMRSLMQNGSIRKR